MSKTLTDEEIAELVKENHRRVWIWARGILGKAGDPPGVRAKELVNVGLQEVLAAAMDDSSVAARIPFKKRVKVHARSKMKNFLDQLQVGAVARVRLPDGTRARHTYSESMDVGAADDYQGHADSYEDSFDDQIQRRGLAELRNRMVRLVQETGPAGWFEERAVLRMDFKEALRRIPDPVDQSLVNTLLKLNDAPPAPWGQSGDEGQEETERLWSHHDKAMEVLIAQEESAGGSAAEIRARLGAAGRWIDAYCNGQPLARYPVTRWHQEDPPFTVM